MRFKMFKDLTKNRYISLLSTIRGVLALLIFSLVNQISTNELGVLTPAVVTMIAIWAGAKFSFSGLSNLRLCAAAVATCLLIYIIPSLTTIFPGPSPYLALLPFRLLHYLQSYLFLALIACSSSVLFWRKPVWTIIEAALVILLVIVTMSPHQDFHYNRPTYINSFAWYLGFTEVAVFLAVGGFTAAIAGVYLYLCASAQRPVAPKVDSSSNVVKGRSSAFASVASATIALVIFFLGVYGAKSYFASAAGGRVSNGVGEASAEGDSPLGFHSALGTTSQPAALVRLEGDYRDNPYAPMLYMRESALSELSGNEYLIAPRRYDTDVPLTPPSVPFTAKTDETLKSRIPVVQSIYILSEQKLSFAIDYPQAIVMLKNPEPGRFRNAYRAHSLALSQPISPNGLVGFKVGDSRWDEATKAHYLKPHKDSRYANLAYQIAAEAGAVSDIEKAFAIADYLTEATTYTLSPNHKVNPGDDPVAHYLFGDLRGYCVHFAHAMVHMYRALGIPARIGTGYLTDLSQSRDGHILLRMSDRHAWSEVYIGELGWIPFDIKPQKVESHGNSDVDMKLLEDLMQKLEPGKEILPEELAKDERSFDDFKPRISGSTVVFVVAGILLLIFGIKFYLRIAWRLTNDAGRKAERGYRAIASILDDLGERRKLGETREEFRTRLAFTFGADILPFVQVGNSLRYGGTGRELTSADFGAVKKVVSSSVLRRMLVALNPKSAIVFITRGAW